MTRAFFHGSPSGKHHHRGPHRHQVKQSTNMFVVEANAAVGHRPPDGPAMRCAVKTNMGATLHLNHLFAIPAPRVGAVQMERNPTTPEGIAPTRRNKCSGCGMPPNRIGGFEQHLMFTGGGSPSPRFPPPQAPGAVDGPGPARSTGDCLGATPAADQVDVAGSAATEPEPGHRSSTPPAAESDQEYGPRQQGPSTRSTAIPPPAELICPRLSSIYFRPSDRRRQQNSASEKVWSCVDQ